MLEIVTPAKTFVIPAYRDIDESLTASKLDGTERISVEEKAKDFLVNVFDHLAHKNQLMGPVRKKWEASSQKVIIFESQVQKLLDHGDLYLWPSFGKDWIHQTPKATAKQLELGLKNKKLKSKLQFMMRLHLEPEHVDEGELTPDEVNNTLTSMYEDIEAAYSIVVDTPGDEKPYVCDTTATESQTGHTGNTTESQNSHTDKSTAAVTPSATKKNLTMAVKHRQLRTNLLSTTNLPWLRNPKKTLTCFRKNQQRKKATAFKSIFPSYECA
jgi:hypothetical protein